MLPGYNHDVRYRSTTFHVQTEDKGRKTARLVTVLFFGGNALAREQSSYTDLLESPEPDPRIKKRMQDQHKRVLKKLVHGGYDDILRERHIWKDRPGEAAAVVLPVSKVPPAKAIPVAGALRPQPAPTQTPLRMERKSTRLTANAPAQPASGNLFQPTEGEKSLYDVILSYLAEEEKKERS